MRATSACCSASCDGPHLRADVEPLALGRHLRLERPGARRGPAVLQFGHQAIAEQGGVGLGVGPRVLVLGLGGGHQGLLGQQRRRGIGVGAPQPGDRRVQLQPRVHDFLLERRIVQLENHRIWLDLGPGAQQDARDAAIGRGGNPRRVDGNEGAGASHLAHQFAALDRVEPQRRAIDGRSRRRHAQHGDAAGDHEHGGDGGHAQALPAAATTFCRTDGKIRHARLLPIKVRASAGGGGFPCKSSARHLQVFASGTTSPKGRPARGP